MHSARTLAWLSACSVASGLPAEAGGQDSVAAALGAGTPRPCQILGPDLTGESVYTPATWPGGVVPYEFDANVNALKRQQFRAAAEQIQQAAAVTFVERTGEVDYLHIQYAAANGAYVGRQGGPQMLYLYDWDYSYIIVHELMHCLGFFHEHQRPDRDSHITVHPCNVVEVLCQGGVPTQPGTVYQSNFAIVNTGLEAGPYDYDSLLHYAACDYSTFCAPYGTCLCPSACQTISAPQPIGQTIGLSAGDIAGLRFLYSWQRPTVGGPSERSGHALAFDTARESLVLFGGRAGSMLSAQTWEWSQESWTLRAAGGGPAPRERHTLAYDSVRSRTVLFGGMGGAGGAMGDTWEWNGSAWAQRNGSGPTPRYSAASDFDSGRGVLVVFGGRGGSDNGDTWEWDGSAWSLKATAGPSPRHDHAMAYDPSRGRIVLFGGNNASGVLGDTWEWDGAGWLLRSTAGPSPRRGHAMAFDAVRGRALVFGGAGGGGEALQDTWEWDGTDWEQRCATGPSPRIYARMAFDSAAREVVLFGGAEGTTPLNDTWTLRGPADCYPNCDGSSVQPLLNVADFTCYLQRFAAGNAWANCDGSTAAPALNVADFTCFLQRFAAGCE